MIRADCSAFRKEKREREGGGAKCEVQGREMLLALAVD